MAPELSAERSRQEIQDHTLRLAKFATAAGKDAPVPTCPDWTVADLVRHVGQTMHWVAEIIEHRVDDPSELPDTEKMDLPDDVDAWSDWLAAAAARATAACSDKALEAEVLNAANDNRRGADFWLHSMLNEAVIHGVDAATAAGHDAGDYDIDPHLAADLVTNHLDMLTSPTWAAQYADSAAAMCGDGETLQWHATDDPGLEGTGEWHVERHADGARWQPRQADADVTVHGSAKTLLLVLTRRVPLTARKTEVTVKGDINLAHYWLKHTAHVAE